MRHPGVLRFCSSYLIDILYKDSILDKTKLKKLFLSNCSIFLRLRNKNRTDAQILSFMGVVYFIPALLNYANSFESPKLLFNSMQIKAIVETIGSLKP